MENVMAEVFLDTQRLLWENEELRCRTWSAVMSTRVYPENFDTTRVMGTHPVKISVTCESIPAAARRFAESGMRIAVLNVANAVSPGGSVSWGGQGVEETLCRCSNLYPCLTKPEIFESFYQYNNQLDGYYSSRIIYSQNVTFFKIEGKLPKYTDRWFLADVITCPAPNLNGTVRIDGKKLRKVLEGRIRNILSVAEANGVGCLVFGDFGCGVYMNPPQLVAQIFYEQLTYGDFRNAFWEVIFAVEDRSNYDIFCQVLSPWQKNPLYGKYVSVLGDSLGSFWPHLTSYFGGRLLANCCVLESMVSGPFRASAGSDIRILGLRQNGKNPDVIFIYTGTWDYLRGVPADAPEEPVNMKENYVNYFTPSYEVMLWKLRRNYPYARIYCGLLCPPLLSEGALEAYNYGIRSCALKYGCYVADIPKYVKSYDSPDGIHASALGFNQLLDGWIQAVEDLADLEEKRKNSRSGTSVRNRTGRFAMKPGNPCHSRRSVAVDPASKWPAAAAAALSVSGVTLAGLLIALMILIIK